MASFLISVALQICFALLFQKLHGLLNGDSVISSLETMTCTRQNGKSALSFRIGISCPFGIADIYNRICITMNDQNRTSVPLKFFCKIQLLCSFRITLSQLHRPASERVRNILRIEL